MKTVSELIEALGGSTQLARRLSVPVSTVGAWKARGSIPARYYMTLVQIAKERKVKGVTLQNIVALKVSA